MTRRLLSYAFPFIDSFDAAAGQVAVPAESDDALQMDEDTFRGFYTRTSGMLWAYLSRATNPHTADDLLQETYYRFLRATVAFESDEHRRNYLFRIATNLVRDSYRRRRPDHHQLPEHGESEIPDTADLARQTQQRADLDRALARLSQRERDMVWLAYGQGSSHHEIAGALGLKPASIKPLLFRARKKLAKYLS